LSVFAELGTSSVVLLVGWLAGSWLDTSVGRFVVLLGRLVDWVLGWMLGKTIFSVIRLLNLSVG